MKKYASHILMYLVLAKLFFFDLNRVLHVEQLFQDINFHDEIVFCENYVPLDL